MSKKAPPPSGDAPSTAVEQPQQEANGAQAPSAAAAQSAPPDAHQQQQQQQQQQNQDLTMLLQDANRSAEFGGAAMAHNPSFGELPGIQFGNASFQAGGLSPPNRNQPPGTPQYIHVLNSSLHEIQNDVMDIDLKVNTFLKEIQLSKSRARPSHNLNTMPADNYAARNAQHAQYAGARTPVTHHYQQVSQQAISVPQVQLLPSRAQNVQNVQHSAYRSVASSQQTASFPIPPQASAQKAQAARNAGDEAAPPAKRGLPTIKSVPSDTDAETLYGGRPPVPQQLQQQPIPLATPYSTNGGGGGGGGDGTRKSQTPHAAARGYNYYGEYKHERGFSQSRIDHGTHHAYPSSSSSMSQMSPRTHHQYAMGQHAPTPTHHHHHTQSVQIGAKQANQLYQHHHRRLESAAGNGAQPFYAVADAQKGGSVPVPPHSMFNLSGVPLSQSQMAHSLGVPSRATPYNYYGQYRHEEGRREQDAREHAYVQQLEMMVREANIKKKLQAEEEQQQQQQRALQAGAGNASVKYVNSVKDLYKQKRKQVVTDEELFGEIKQYNIDFLKYPYYSLKHDKKQRGDLKHYYV